MESSVPCPSTGSTSALTSSAAATATATDGSTLTAAIATPLNLNRATTIHGTPSRSHGRRPSIPMSPSLLTSSPLNIPFAPRSKSPSGSAMPLSSPGLGSGSGYAQGSIRADTSYLPGHRKAASSSQSHAPSQSHSSSFGVGMSVPTSSYLGSSPRASALSPGAGSMPAPGLGRRRSYMEPVRPDMRLDTAFMDRTMTESVQMEVKDGDWLDTSGEAIWRGVRIRPVIKVVHKDMRMEEAVEALLSDDCQCLLVQLGGGDYAFFDFADLNTFLLLVLHATTERSHAPSRSVSVSSHMGRTTIDTIPYIDEEAVEDEEVPSVLDDRSRMIVKRLRRMDRVTVGTVCDISGKNPYTVHPASTPLRGLLPLFASGLHKIALTSPQQPDPIVLTDITVIEHLISLPTNAQPPILGLAVSDPSVGFPLHPLISLPGTASVLDAMQVMSMNGLSALGVLSGSGSCSRARRESSGSSGSSSGGGHAQIGWAGVPRSSSGLALSASPLVSPGISGGTAGSDLSVNPFDAFGGALHASVGSSGELRSIVTAEECTRVVVPSEGKQVLGMGLAEMVRNVQYVEAGGRERGEERVPVHTVPYNSTILHAAHLILATSSSRVFVRPNPIVNGLGTPPPLSPTPSLSNSLSSPPSSPSLSSLSLSESRGYIGSIPGSGIDFSSGHGNTTTGGLPPPPPTQLSAHHVISVLDILSCLARAYHQFLTLPEGVKVIQALTLSERSAASSLTATRPTSLNAESGGGATSASFSGSGSGSGIIKSTSSSTKSQPSVPASPSATRLTFKDADMKKDRRDRGRVREGEEDDHRSFASTNASQVRSAIPRSKLRGSIMMMPIPSGGGGVAGWELDIEHLRRQREQAAGRGEGGEGVAGLPIVGSGQDLVGQRRQRQEEEGSGQGKRRGEGEGEGAEAMNTETETDAQKTQSEGYGGWRWAARVRRDT